MTRHRTLFLSDFHLGSRLAKVDHLLDFLDRNDAETIYLVGDIWDIKRLKRVYYWPESHQRVIRALRAKAPAGTRLVIVPGNHDPELRYRSGARGWLPGVEIQQEAVHQTADGRRLLVTHGDLYEPPRGESGLSFKLGIIAYLLGVKANERIAAVRRRLGLGWWSLSVFLKDRLLDHVRIARQYKLNLVQAARERGFDGVISGHIHHARIETIDGIVYANDGDWVESNTALAEDADGRLRLIYWTGARGLRVGASDASSPAGADFDPAPGTASTT
jgi:UDP-2,3-diacylglucosamine pyrophosphatase LpxH